IVGPWQGAKGAPSLTQNNTANLSRLDYGVRASVFDFELLSHLCFTDELVSVTQDDGSIIKFPKFLLWHVHVKPKLPPKGHVTVMPIVAMISPTLDTFKAQLDLVDGYS